MEIITKEDCIGTCKIKGKKRCFTCGNFDKCCCWVEYDNGTRMVRHYLCKDCRDKIPTMAWLNFENKNTWRTK